MKSSQMLICLWALTVSVAIASRGQTTAPSGAAAEKEFRQVAQDFDKSMEEFSKAYQGAKTDAERQKIFSDLYPKPQKYADRLLAIARENPKSGVALDSLVWLISHGTPPQTESEALKILATDFADNPKVAQQIVPRLQWSSSAEARQLIEAVIDKAPDAAGKGTAKLTLAVYLKNNGNAKDAEKLLDEVAANYADVKFGSSSLADAARAELFEIRDLAVGKPAPEIVGQSVNGTAMKLSDYRGKVVVLDFFGDW